MNDNDAEMDNLDSSDITDSYEVLEEIEMMLSLTRNEALFIDDSLSMLIDRDPHDLHMSTVRPLSHTAGLPAPVD